MELKDILQQMMQESMQAAQLSDLQIGTVNRSQSIGSYYQHLHGSSAGL